MANPSERAGEIFTTGFNCAQSVLGAHAQALGLDEETALKLAAPFGGGMGRLREVCGALTGLFMAAGLKYGYTDPTDLDSKAKHYQLVQDLAGQFKAQFGSILCRDLIPLDGQSTDPVPEVRTEGYYQRRPCVEYVRYAASLLDQQD